jgi:hypothetical protein
LQAESADYIARNESVAAIWNQSEKLTNEIFVSLSENKLFIKRYIDEVINTEKVERIGQFIPPPATFFSLTESLLLGPTISLPHHYTKE